MNDHTSSGSLHSLGDGWHYLPVSKIDGTSIERVTSEPCVLLLFVEWARRNDFDASEIYERAWPQGPLLRADELELYRQWTDVPDQIELAVLRDDLEDINEHALLRVLDEVESGAFRPGSAFTHWIVSDDGRIAGEARDLDPAWADGPDEQGQFFSYVRLFAMPDCAEWGYTNAGNFRPKEPAERSTACSQ